VETISIQVRNIGTLNPLTAPVLLVIIIRRKQTPTGDSTKSPSSSIDNSVAHNTGDEPISDGIRERHEHERDESGDRVARVVPVDGQDTTHHHAAD